MIAQWAETSRSTQRTFLQSHPDKTGSSNAQSFLDVSAAYDLILNNLKASRSEPQGSVIVQDTLDLTDFYHSEEDGQDMWLYDCRCGGVFVLNDLSELLCSKADRVIVPCNTCTLCIEVLPPIESKP